MIRGPRTPHGRPQIDTGPFCQQTSMTISTSSISRTFRTATQRFLTAGVVLSATSSAWALQKAVPTGGGTRQAPEINPAFIVGAVVLIVGSILILTSRRRRIAKA